ncbi:dipeptidase [Sphingosinicella rhizophila]|uniref:Membrane dipeptidase n=1 Tax=Sphingosinicella rhizophila TaxID=3050082 RepID=A0ABU3Q9N5_9SPHN|nr:membrane dipeptidase [Sphingosinicella sp. GR2756]MDT9599824.1 membrane dipeptidase [Sphingosinicella sp. GR2756]
MFDRRELLRFGGSAALLAWALPALGKAADLAPLMKDAEDLYKEAIVIDLLADERRDAEGLRYIQESGYTVMSTTLGTRSPESPQGSHMLNAWPRDGLIADCIAWQGFIDDHQDKLLHVTSAADIRRAKAEGKNGILLNSQNCPADGKLENIDLFHELGIRQMQLTYNERNLLGDGATERTNSGLSDFGVAVVERMNELGIMVDTSHSAWATCADAIKFSKKPPIFSHTECHAISQHPRNKPDELIKALAAKGGVMGLTTVGPMVTNDPIPATMDRFLDHVDHVVKLVGVNHVGFGTDTLIRGWPTDPKLKKETLAFYGEPYFKDSYRFRYPMGTEGMNDQHKIKYATGGLIRRGYKRDDILKILGGNWLRVIGEVVG